MGTMPTTPWSSQRVSRIWDSDVKSSAKLLVPQLLDREFELLDQQCPRLGLRFCRQPGRPSCLRRWHLYSLLTGGVGILNIMLVSVTERTREIGIRMAVGARRRDILLQFLFEAVGLSVLGGMAGVILGLVAAYGFAYVADWSLIVDYWAVISAVLFSMLVGILFGWYPALRASDQRTSDIMRKSIAICLTSGTPISNHCFEIDHDGPVGHFGNGHKRIARNKGHACAVNVDCRIHNSRVLRQGGDACFHIGHGRPGEVNEIQLRGENW